MPLLYDASGNLQNDATGKAYEWDAANRLAAISYPGNKRTEFSYDGLSRRVQILEKASGSVTSTKQFVWVGNRIAEERDANNVITQRYFADGEQRIGGGDAGLYYYTRDHLDSVREVTSSTGALQARYDYDPYGNRTKLSGTLDVDFGFTGHYFHAPSGLNLTLYRAYSPTLGRWLSRDPIGEAGGLNLYGYVLNDPVNLIDPLGLHDLNVFPPNEDIRQYADRATLYNDRYTVAGHGAPHSMLDSNGNDLPPEKLAELIKKDPKYDPNKPVQLDACQTGREKYDGLPSYGQMLAGLLNNIVKAPTEDIIFRPDGSTYIPNGTYRIYRPRP